MAPSKNAKRSARAAAEPLTFVLQDIEPSPKKQRVDPKFEGMLTTLENADYLNEHCRAMLIAFSSSLKTPQNVRHPAQILGVKMIEEILQDARKKFADAAALALEERTGLEGSKGTRVARMNAALSSVELKQAAQNTAQAVLDAAQDAVKTAQATLATAQEAHLEGEKPLAALEQEKSALELVIQEHFRAPMELGQGPHFNFLEPFTEKLVLEESLIKALPSSCIKTKEQRGGFDELVIAEFDKALVAKVASLEKSIAEEVPAVAQRKEAVASAESSLAGKVADDEAAAVKLAAMTAVRVEADAELCKATDDCTVLEPTLEMVILKHDSLQAELKDFENGTLANFEELRDKSVEVEAATAGA